MASAGQTPEPFKNPLTFSGRVANSMHAGRVALGNGMADGVEATRCLGFWQKLP